MEPQAEAAEAAAEAAGGGGRRRRQASTSAYVQVLEEERDVLQRKEVPFCS